MLSSRPLKPATPIPGLEDTPLSLHASYGIREILTAVGWLTAERRTPFQAGVLALHERQVELLFITLDKRDGYHERIAYHDYAISPERFHWQSQNAAGPETRSRPTLPAQPRQRLALSAVCAQQKGRALPGLRPGHAGARRGQQTHDHLLAA